MAKSKVSKAIHPTQKHLHSRISFLYQAATYFTDVNRNKQKDQVAKIKPRDYSVTNSPLRETSLPSVTPSSAERLPNAGEFDWKQSNANKDTGGEATHAIARQLTYQLNAISLKGQIRLSSAIKHSLCRRCEALLIAGSTSTHQTENKSRSGRKPWADVHVIKCNACGSKKRFPVGAKCQLRRIYRGKDGTPCDIGKNVSPSGSVTLSEQVSCIPIENMLPASEDPDKI